MYSKSILLILICSMTLLSACNSDEKPESERILGSWKLEKATRNDRITNSLDGMYMIFETDKSFDSNILGDSSSYSVQIDRRKIKVDHDIIRLFDIKELTDSTMRLSFDINDDKLLLVFNK